MKEYQKNKLPQSLAHQTRHIWMKKRIYRQIHDIQLSGTNSTAIGPEVQHAEPPVML